MNYLTLFWGNTLFNKLWFSFDKRAKLDLWLTKELLLLLRHVNSILFLVRLVTVLKEVLFGTSTIHRGFFDTFKTLKLWAKPPFYQFSHFRKNSKM